MSSKGTFKKFSEPAIAPPISVRIAAENIPIRKLHSKEFIEAFGLVLTRKVPIKEAIMPIPLIIKGSMTNLLSAGAIPNCGTPIKIANEIVAIKDPA